MVNGHQYRVENLASVKLIRVRVTVCVGVSDLDCTIDAVTFQVSEYERDRTAHQPTLPRHDTVRTAFLPGFTSLGSSRDFQLNTGLLRRAYSVSYASAIGRSPSVSACCAGAMVESSKVSLIKSIGSVDIFSTVRRIVDL
jgi:hypothetical protein